MSIETGNNELWFALQVRVGRELSIARGLCFSKCQIFVPCSSQKKRWSDRVKDLQVPLFSGYVFCKFNIQDRLPILITSGVIRIVGTRKGIEPILDCEIEAIRRVVESRINVEPCAFLESGSKVRVEGGPLAGVEGMIDRIENSRRLVLSINLLQRSVAVKVDEACVVNITTSHNMKAEEQPRTRQSA